MEADLRYTIQFSPIPLVTKRERSNEMAELKIYLTDSLSEKFRRIAMSIYGYGRGSLSKAAEDAFSKWCAQQDHSDGKVGKYDLAQTVTRAENGDESYIDPDERQNPNPGLKKAMDNEAHPRS